MGTLWVQEMVLKLGCKSEELLEQGLEKLMATAKERQWEQEWGAK
jgi:hypothetical protein